MSPEETIRRALNVQNFLANEDVSGALKTIAATYYAEFRAADSSEKRVQAWSKANVLEDFLNELQVIVSRGEMAQEVANRTKKE